MTADEIRNWVPNPSVPRGTLPDLPSTGGGLLGQFMGDVNNLKNSPLYRIGVDHNINPEFTNLMGGLLGRGAQDLINKGLLDFKVEVPGYNSNRLFFGFDRRF